MFDMTALVTRSRSPPTQTSKGRVKQHESAIDLKKRRKYARKRTVVFVRNVLILTLLMTGLIYAVILYCSISTEGLQSEINRAGAGLVGVGLSHEGILASMEEPTPKNLTSLRTTQSKSSPSDTHAIPRILIFTHYRNLLDGNATLTDKEEIVLAANIRKVIQLHSQNDVTTKVRFLTDDQCIASLQNTYPALIPHFKAETQGMYKADICRGSALYETGGMYLDVDVGVRKDLWLDLALTTEFVTSLVHRQSKYPKHFFQAVLGAGSQSPIIHKYLELFENHYTAKERIESGPLGVILLRRAWDRVYDARAKTPATELYQEVLYDKKLFPHLHPAPTWGIRRACHFVVMAAVNHAEHAELFLHDKPFHVPLYSRIAGSRMCPIKQHHHEHSHEHHHHHHHKENDESKKER